jgi:hypothetical protein
MRSTLLFLSSIVAALGSPLKLEDRSTSACKKTQVAVLGAGAAGTFAAVSQNTDEI